MDRANVDTDAIIPKQYLKSIQRTGFGPNLFDEWRYLDHGSAGQDCSVRPRNPQFVLNLPRYQGASILLARKNFGCGSSREHAVWALGEAGFRAVIAPSFSDIFYTNCFKNGFLPIVLDEREVDALFRECHESEGYSLTIDLESCLVTTPDGQRHNFKVDGTRRECLLRGLDEIGMTLEHSEAIREYEARRKVQAPWLFADGFENKP
jgi:3-isopropylmalate/(R)-2-methylmalate dehydratase small subunit